MFRSAPPIAVLLPGMAFAGATPAISEGRLLLRTQDMLMAIGKK